MPIGPSHSGRSSGGRSFGGGSRGGGSFSFGSGHSHGSKHLGRQPIRFHFFGRHYVLTGGGSILSILVFVIFFAITFITSMASGISNYKEDIAYYQSQIQTMKDDSVFFLNLIQEAKAGTDGYYLATATIDNNPLDERPFITYEFYSSNPTTPGAYYSFQDSQAIWYFVVYKYTNKSGTLLNGMTYAQYSYSQLPQTGNIEVAYTYYENNWWSINTDYSLEKNKDYDYSLKNLKNAKNEKANTTKSLIITCVIIGAIVIACIWMLKKKIKVEKEKSEIEKQKALAEVDEAIAKAEQAQKAADQIGRKCKYCGSSVPDNVDKCENCGSSMFE